MRVHTPDLVGLKKRSCNWEEIMVEGEMGGIRAERMEALIQTLYMHL